MRDGAVWLRVGVAGLVVAVLGGFACARRSGERGSVAEVSVSATQDTPRQGALGERPLAGSEAGVVRCGEGRCEAGKEVCCHFLGVASACAPRVGLSSTGEPSDADRTQAQLETCRGEVEGAESAYCQISHCDDSSDCPEGMICCSEALSGEAGYSACKPARPDGASPCQGYEDCVEGSACAVPGTVCRGRVCKKADVRVSCGDRRCSAAAPVCCESASSPPVCVAEADCAEDLAAGRFAVECRGRADCPAGMYCCAGFGHAYCSGECINVPFACEVDADCPAEVVGFPLRGCVASGPNDPPPARRFCLY